MDGNMIKWYRLRWDGIGQESDVKLEGSMWIKVGRYMNEMKKWSFAYYVDRIRYDGKRN